MAAVDATGLETRHVSAHFGHRRAKGRGRKGHRQRAWPKLTTVFHTHSHLMLAAVPGLGPSQGSPDFVPALRQAAEHIAFHTVLGDAGYDAEHVRMGRPRRWPMRAIMNTILYVLRKGGAWRHLPREFPP